MKNYETLHREFQKIAREFPNRVALIYQNERITFRELDLLSNSIALSFLESDLKSERPIVIMMNPSIKAVILLIGALKAGKTAIPVLASFPAARLNAILKVTNADIVSDAKISSLELAPTSTAFLFSDFKLKSIESIPELQVTNDIAFILSSSGSTGVPKLIKRYHSSFFPQLNWAWETLPYNHDEVCCQRAYIGAPIAILELFEPLLKGVPVVIVEEEKKSDLEGFWKLLRDFKVSRMKLVPSVFRSSLSIESFDPAELNSIVFMGEAIDLGLAQEARKKFGSTCKLYSMYGSSEVGSFLVEDLNAAIDIGNITLGRPLAKQFKAVVLDGDEKEVKTGDVGTLHIQGVSFAGFAGTDEMPADVWSVNKFLKVPLFCTKDRVRVLSSGNVEYLGRSDHTVKIRGLKVDLDEIERALIGISGIKAAAVITGTDPKGNLKVVAIVSPKTVDVNSVILKLKLLLPPYMVPEEFHLVDLLPLNSNGKIDRIRLKNEYGS